MITINRGRLDLVAKEYLSRLINYGKAHKRSEVGKIVKELSVKELKDLILCPPEQLKTFPVPKVIGARFLRAYYRYFTVIGDDGVNNAIWLSAEPVFLASLPYLVKSSAFFSEVKYMTLNDF